MNLKWIGMLGLMCLAPLMTWGQQLLVGTTNNALGLVTNGPAIWQRVASTQIYSNIPPPNLPPRFYTNAAFLRTLVNYYTVTNLVFDEYLPGTLHHLVWTNFLAITNGCDMRIWAERTHPEGWPKTPPVAKWNTHSVIWNMKGVTALSPCWDGEGAPGQVPLTVLTRRHIYTRGHSFGDDGFHPSHNGKTAWFFTRENQRIEGRVKSSVVRTPMPSRRDYTILLLDHDLPDSIETMPVALLEDMQKHYPMPSQGTAPYPFFQTEQGGNVSTGVAPLTVNTWKGGDSGSPNLIPLPGQLVFVSGRSTSGPSREMQEDMDELCRRAKLDPKNYQLRWVGLGNIAGP
jgi:hypothetical protein